MGREGTRGWTRNIRGRGREKDERPEKGDIKLETRGRGGKEGDETLQTRGKRREGGEGRYKSGDERRQARQAGDEGQETRGARAGQTGHKTQETKGRRQATGERSKSMIPALLSSTLAQYTAYTALFLIPALN